MSKNIAMKMIRYRHGSKHLLWTHIPQEAICMTGQQPMYIANYFRCFQMNFSQSLHVQMCALTRMYVCACTRDTCVRVCT